MSSFKIKSYVIKFNKITCILDDGDMDDNDADHGDFDVN